MGNLVFQATLGGQVNLVGPNTASTYNLNVPTVNATLATTDANTFTAAQTISSGNLIFSGTGQKITGDYSNATLTSRAAFQTSTTNGSTGIYALPNGTSTAASWQATNAADPTNASKVLIATNGSTDVQLVSGRNGTGTYLPLTFYTNGSEQMRLDTSGNLGLGVTPSASNLVTLQSTYGIFVGNSQSNITKNAYYNSGWKYVSSDTATQYQQASGEHRWLNAASGTAGNAITFTQAMTLDASGNLCIGSTSTRGVYKLDIRNDNSIAIGGNASFYGTIGYSASTGLMSLAAESGGGINFLSGSTERARIDSSGNLLVGKTVATYTTNGVSLSNVGSNFSYTSAAAVAVNRNGTDGTIIEFYKAGTYVGNISVTGSITTYNSVSDYRLKNNPVPITGAKEFIMALQPKTWDWRNGLGKGVGFIAHEFMEVAKYSGNGEKDAVDENGNPVYQSIQPSSSEVMANLIAHIQELETRLAALENK